MKKGNVQKISPKIFGYGLKMFKKIQILHFLGQKLVSTNVDISINFFEKRKKSKTDIHTLS